MREKPKIELKSEAVFSLEELTRMLQDLQKRVKLLERAASGQVEYGLMLTEPDTLEPRMGRKPKLEVDKLIERRDPLSRWIESHWSVLSRKLANPKDPQFAAYAFVKAREKLGAVFFPKPPFYDAPERFIEELWQFLNSGRFAGDPRNLAGAMAGLPELSWKRSLDLSQQNPMTYPLHPDAWRDHLRRNFHERFRELQTAKSAEEVKAILARSSSRDLNYQHFRKYPAEVLIWVVRRHSIS